jgi:hypothetical protein
LYSIFFNKTLALSSRVFFGRAQKPGKWFSVFLFTCAPAVTLPTSSVFWRVVHDHLFCFVLFLLPYLQAFHLHFSSLLLWLHYSGALSSSSFLWNDTSLHVITSKSEKEQKRKNEREKRRKKEEGRKGSLEKGRRELYLLLVDVEITGSLQ